jgi:hypothetical protein
MSQETSIEERLKQLSQLDSILAPYGARYIKVRANTKQAAEPCWYDNLKTLEQITPWIEKGGNYGIVADERLIMIDLDDPQLFNKLPKTLTIQSPGSGGQHCYYQNVNIMANGTLYREKPENNLGHIQVSHKYVVGPGSIHPCGKMYTILDFTPPAEITEQAVETAFPTLVHWKGVKDIVENTEVFHYDRKLDITKIVPMRNLMKAGNEYFGPHPIHGSKGGHNFYVNPEKGVWHCFRCDSGGGALSWIALEEGIIQCPEAARGALKGQKFRRTLDLAVEKGYLRSDQLPSLKTEEKSEKKTKAKDSGVSSDGVFEAVYVDGNPVFIVTQNGKFSVVDSVTVGDSTFHPKTAEQVPYTPYGVYSGDAPDREDLFWKTREKIDLYIDIESIWKDVLAAAVLLSYQQEKCVSVPYFYPYGDNESGKTTLEGLLALLCYRPMFGVTIPAADLYGFLEDSDSVGTIIEDEIQGVDTDIDKVKIYKSGYKRGAKVPRMINTEDDRIIKYYNTFSMKFAAGEQIPLIKGFAERFIFLPMIEGVPQKEWVDITKEELQEFYELRNMLLKWRMASHDWEMPTVELTIKGRMKELWKPLLQITKGLPVFETLYKFLTDQQAERLETKQNTLEGHIVKTVLEVALKKQVPGKELSKDPLLFIDLWDSLRVDLDGHIDSERSPHVMETSEFGSVSKSRVGHRLHEVLGGKSKPVRTKEGDRDKQFKGYEFNFDKLRRVGCKYGYKDRVTELLMLPTSAGVPPRKNRKEGEESMKSQSESPLKSGENTAQKTFSKEGTSPENGNNGNTVTNRIRQENSVTGPEKNEPKVFVAEDCIHHWKSTCENPRWNVVMPTEPCPGICKAFLAKTPEQEEQNNGQH